MPRIDPKEALTVTTIHHATNCPDPRELRPFRASRGDLMIRCASCRRFTVLDDDRTPDDKRKSIRRTNVTSISPRIVSTPPDAPEPPKTPRATGWVCRDHHYPVTPKGNGCPDCQHPRGHGTSTETTATA